LDAELPRVVLKNKSGVNRVCKQINKEIVTMVTKFLQVSVACFENNNDAFTPELWANEGLAILQENMV
jgi:hypothetical protein